jgi:hypothetical protein
LKGGKRLQWLRSYLGKFIDIEITGGRVHQALLIDIGPDIVVVYNGVNFLYIPFIHIHYIKQSIEDSIEMYTPPEVPIENGAEMISYRKVLNNAKGLFVEIYITGNQTIHGYFTSVMNDYFVFYSPVHHTTFISLNHLKYLIPYAPNSTPYSLSQNHFPFNPTNVPLARTFDQQLKKVEGKIVVLDLGETPNKIGLLREIKDGIIELVTAKGEIFYWNVNHIKTVNLP